MKRKKRPRRKRSIEDADQIAFRVVQEATGRLPKMRRHVAIPKKMK